MAKFVIYKDASTNYRWRFKANNGNIIADSAEGYVSKQGARDGIDFVKSYANRAPVEDTTPSW
jgi:hypothetical protein